MVALLDLALLVLEQLEHPQRLVVLGLPEHLQKELALARLVHSQKSAVVALLGHSRKSVVVALVLLVLEQFLLLVRHLGTHQLQVLLQFLIQPLNDP